MEHRPIFIGGLSFTGKTQLRMMLSAHPNILINRHTHLWDRFYQRYGNLKQSDNLERCLAAMRSSKHIRSLNPDTSKIRQEFQEGAATYERLFAILHAQYAAQKGKSRWGDQLAFIEHYADRIFAAYPSAKMIHMVRDPGARSGESGLTSYRRAGRLGWETAWWLSSSRLASRHLNNYSGRYLVIRYEQLFFNPEQTLREICSFLDEPFYAEMLAHGEIESHAMNPQVSLSKRDLHFIRSHARRAMELFGYVYDDLQLSHKDRMLYALGWPANLAGLLTGTLGAEFGRREFFRRELT